MTKMNVVSKTAEKLNYIINNLNEDLGYRKESYEKWLKQLEESHESIESDGYNKATNDDYLATFEAYDNIIKYLENYKF